MKLNRILVVVIHLSKYSVKWKHRAPSSFCGQMSSSKNQAGDEAVTDRRSSNENYRKWFSMIAGSPWHCLVAPPASNFYHAFHLNRFRHSCWSRGTCPSSAHYKASNQTVAWGLFWTTVVKNLTLCRNSSQLSESSASSFMAIPIDSLYFKPPERFVQFRLIWGGSKIDKK